MTATCDKCETKLSDDEIDDCELIYEIEVMFKPVEYCVGCVMVNMKPSEELMQ